MDAPLVAVIALATAGAGFGLGWLIARTRQAVLTERLNAAENAAAQAGILRQEAESLRLKQAESEARAMAERKAAEEKLALVESARAKLDEAFAATAQQALAASSRTFLELAKATFEKSGEAARGELDLRRQAVEALVKPLAESLGKVDQRIVDLEKAREGAYGELRQQLASLGSTQATLTRETANLVKALRTPQARGRWGEMQLRRVVELAGMLAHCDFSEQSTTDDSRLRPDLVVHLPGGKTVVVDAKTPLLAWLEALEAADDATRAHRLAQHAVQVKAHLTGLGRKAYWDQFGDRTPEFAVLFLPSESVFSAALADAPDLIEYGVEQRVLVATPTTLIALLKAVAFGWRQERMADNAAEVAALGKELSKRLTGFVEHLDGVGDHLGKAVTAYNKAAASLESRVLVQARRFHDLGAAAGEALPGIEAVDQVPRKIG